MDHKLHFLWTDVIRSGCQPSEDRSEQPAGFSGCLCPDDVKVRRRRTVGLKQLVSTDQQARDEELRCSLGPNVKSDWLICGSGSNVYASQSGKSSQSIKEVPGVSATSEGVQQETDPTIHHKLDPESQTTETCRNDFSYSFLKSCFYSE